MSELFLSSAELLIQRAGVHVLHQDHAHVRGLVLGDLGRRLGLLLEVAHQLLVLQAAVHKLLEGEVSVTVHVQVVEDVRGFLFGLSLNTIKYYLGFHQWQKMFHRLIFLKLCIILPSRLPRVQVDR